MVILYNKSFNQKLKKAKGEKMELTIVAFLFMTAVAVLGWYLAMGHYRPELFDTTDKIKILKGVMTGLEIANNQAEQELKRQIAKNEKLRLAVTQKSIDRALEMRAREIRDATVYVKSELAGIIDVMDPALSRDPLEFMDTLVDSLDVLKTMIQKPFNVFNDIDEMALENGFNTGGDYRMYLVAAPANRPESTNNQPVPRYHCLGTINPSSLTAAEKVRASVASGEDTTLGEPDPEY